MKNKSPEESIHEFDNSAHRLGLGVRVVRDAAMLKIAQIITSRGLTQKAAGKLLNLSQPKISVLMKKKSTLSLEHLFKILNDLDVDIEVTIKSKVRNAPWGHTIVFFATKH